MEVTDVEFEQSALMVDVDQIINGGANPVQFTVGASLLVTAINTVVTPLKVTGIDLRRDYLNRYSDELVITTEILAGQYSNLVYPYKNAIDLTLMRTPLMEVGDTPDASSTVQSERFTATLLDEGSPLLEQNAPFSPTQPNLDLTGPMTVQFQLVNKALEQMRMMDVGQVFRGCTVDDAIRTVLTKASQTTTVDGQRTVQGVSMIPSANPTPREHIVIPHGVRLVDVPQHIQKHCGGVYNAGMGYFLQGNQWYVWPALDTTRFNSATATLTVINVPANKFPQVERTYRQSGTNLMVMATGSVKFRDPSNHAQLNLGNGVRFSDASKFMDGFVSVSENRALASRGSVNNEFIGTSRPNGNNNVHVSGSPVNANSLEEYSKLARAMGASITMEWENSSPDLIVPGMPAQVLCLQNEQIQTLVGVVIGAQHYTQMRGQGFSASRYITTTHLNIFLQPQDQTGNASATPASTP